MLDTIVAFSDSHNNPLSQRFIDIANENEYVFFLGDGLARLGDIVLHKGFHGIKGNCDSVAFPKEEVICVGGINVLLTHGDAYGVKSDLLRLAMRAKELNCTVVFYGHTHFASIDEYDGITLVCPGALSQSVYGEATYVYATVYNRKFTAKIVKLSQIC